jgi:opacity protein-like surface antigen
MNRYLKFAVMISLLVLAGYNICFSQAKEPLSFEGILRLPDFGLSSKQIADQIAESGLAFDVTSAHIDSLRRLGFDSSIVNAVRQFYKMGILNIAVSPPQVNVLIDNEPHGRTDASGYWQKEISRGIHNIKLEKRGYETVDTSLTIVKDKTVNLRLGLRKGIGYGPSRFFGRYGVSLSYGISITPPRFDEEGKWKSGNNIILSGKANLHPLVFVDLDLNFASFSDFDPEEGDDFGSLSAINFSIIPGVYKEYKEKFRGYLGLGIEINSSKIENGKFEDDGVLYIPDEKGSKTAFALMTKIGADALVNDNIFLFLEYRGYSVLGQYSMGFIAIGAGMYVR